jgi:hypothetical protein
MWGVLSEKETNLVEKTEGCSRGALNAPPGEERKAKRTEPSTATGSFVILTPIQGSEHLGAPSAVLEFVKCANWILPGAVRLSLCKL